VIGVACTAQEKHVVREFFELFKTPWEPWRPDRRYDVVIVSGREPPRPLDARLSIVFGTRPTAFDSSLGLDALRPRRAPSVVLGGQEVPIYGDCTCFGDEDVVVEVADDRSTTVRCGYNLFSEVEFLLTKGQPAENASIATLDAHIDALREWILGAGIPLVEIPPAPAGVDFIVSLTHDIDFLDIRRHGLDRTVLGFLYRALIGSAVDLAAGRSSLRRAARNWKAAAALPLVHLGLVRDPWSPFEDFTTAEGDLRSTFFVIPFRDRVGLNVSSPIASRRAAPYDVDDIGNWISRLGELRFEVAVHGIDAWCSAAHGRDELDRLTALTGDDEVGVRMHWLCYDEDAPVRLEAAGFAYDSTFGYNDAIGFRAGTSQVFRPLGTTRLLELPLHIQDMALLSPNRLHLDEGEAAYWCRRIAQHVEADGGVLTILWHERSLAPERQWDGFYERLLEMLRERRTWFATAGDAVRWFRRRRALTLGAPIFDGRNVRLAIEGDEASAREGPPLCVRVHLPGARHGPHRRIDVPYTGGGSVSVDLGGSLVA
jgi:hypothetical protein